MNNESAVSQTKPLYKFFLICKKHFHKSAVFESFLNTESYLFHTIVQKNNQCILLNFTLCVPQKKVILPCREYITLVSPHGI